MSFTKVKNNNLYDPDLVTLAEKGVGTGADQIVQRDGSGDIAGLVKTSDIGVNVQAFDATIMVDADIGTTVQAYHSTGYESLPVLKSVNYTAVAGDTVLVTAGAITITLPLSPIAGDTVIVKDGTGTADVTNWTVGRNGSNIASSPTDLTFDKNWAELCMTYINVTIGWSV